MRERNVSAAAHGLNDVTGELWDLMRAAEVSRRVPAMALGPGRTSITGAAGERLSVDPTRDHCYEAGRGASSRASSVWRPSRIARSFRRSFWFARRIAAAITGAATDVRDLAVRPNCRGPNVGLSIHA